MYSIVFVTADPYKSQISYVLVIASLVAKQFRLPRVSFFVAYGPFKSIVFVAFNQVHASPGLLIAWLLVKVHAVADFSLGMGDIHFHVKRPAGTCIRLYHYMTDIGGSVTCYGFWICSRRSTLMV